MATRISLDQLDEFEGLLALLTGNDHVFWNDTTKKFERTDPPPPGNWSLVDKGTTSVAYGTEIVLKNHDPGNPEILMPMLTPRDLGETANDPMFIHYSNTANPNDVRLGEVVFSQVRPVTSGAGIDFRVIHKVKTLGSPPEQATLTIDWALFKVDAS